MPSPSPVAVMLITAPYFCAGVEFDQQMRVTNAAPIVRYMIGWDWMRLQQYLTKKKWGQWLTYLESQGEGTEPEFSTLLRRISSFRHSVQEGRADRTRTSETPEFASSTLQAEQLARAVKDALS